MVLKECISNPRTIKAYENLEERFIDKHNNLYSYEESIFEGMGKKIEITCPKHGPFYQAPAKHLISGCKKCSLERVSPNKYSTEEFIAMAKRIHGNRFIYDCTNYTNKSIRVDIRCKNHGIFTILPGSHLGGSGCQKCAKNYNLSPIEYIAQAKLIFPEYDFSCTKFVNMKNPINVKCNIHGIFTKNAFSLLRGYKCPKCILVEKISKGSFYRSPSYYKGRKTKLYYIKIKYKQEYFYKIGLSVSTTEKRYKKENMEYDIIKEWDFQDGYEAATIEQDILIETMDLMVENHKQSGIIPSGGGSSELRTECILDLINKHEYIKKLDYSNRKEINE